MIGWAVIIGVISALCWPVPACSQTVVERDGKGAPDPALQKAAEGGDVSAMERLGFLLFQQDPKAGLPWLQKAAEAGSARSALVLGIALFNGDGITKNQAEGFAWIDLAHARGEVAARKTLDQVLPLLSAEELTKGRQRSGQLAQISPQRSGLASADSSRRKARNRKLENADSSDPASGKTAAVERAVDLQLGSFSSVALAKAAWAQLSRRHPVLGTYDPSFVRFRAFTRLRIANVGAEQGTALCASLRRQGQACLLFR